MSLIAIVLVFIMAIVVTVFLSHLLPVKVPLPLIQIAAGAALAASGFQVDFDPHIFLLLFTPAAAVPRWLAHPQRRFFPRYEADFIAGDRPGDGDYSRYWPVYSLADPGYHRGGRVRPRGYSVAYRSGGGIGNDRQLAASLKDGAYSRRGVVVKRCFRARRL